MKRYTTILMAGALVLALSFAAGAQSGDQVPSGTQLMDGSSTVMGTVVSVSPISLVIELAGGDQMVFIRDANSIVPETLSAGSTVRVNYETPEAGTFHLSRVMLDTTTSSPAPQAPEAASSSPVQPTESAAGQPGSGSETLPGTASPLATIGLLGILALGGGLTLRTFRR